MGSSASKAARAAGSAARKYPTKSVNPATTTQAPPRAAQPQPGPTAYPSPQASGTRTAAIDLDAHDPVLGANLRSLGAVQPNPHFSPSSISDLDPRRGPQSQFGGSYPNPSRNPAIAVLEARQRFQEEADEELAAMGRRGFQGRRMTDAATIKQALVRRQKGERDQDLEKILGLQRGRLRLLERGIVGAV